MKDSFILYTKYRKQLSGLTAEQKGNLLDAIFAYVAGEDLPKLDDMTSFAFGFIRVDLDENNAKYQERCRINAINGKKGGEAKASNSSERKQTLANGGESSRYDNDMNMNIKKKILKEKPRNNSFNNFPERVYNFAELEQQLREN